MLPRHLSASRLSGSVIFRGTCQYHWEYALRGHKLLPLADEHSDEILSGADCDMCHGYSCRDYGIACHKCDVYWHMQCAHMTPEQAEAIDKWYCERCRNTEPQLQITFKDGHGTEEGDNDNLAATPPPGPSSGTLHSAGDTLCAMYRQMRSGIGLQDGYNSA